jgi:hypothetical protein
MAHLAAAEMKAAVNSYSYGCAAAVATANMTALRFL